MSNYEATKYDFNGANLTGIEGIPTATIVPWSDSSVPSGFLECNGAAVSRTTYSALFAIVGTTYGAGNGSTTFKLQHSSDNSTFADLITFTVVSAGTQTSEQKSVSGTINRYKRVNVVSAGSTGAITYSLATSRR